MNRQMHLNLNATRYISALGLSLLLWSCNPQSQPIDYGADKCEFCRMSIVDQRFGGEIVTQKGKIYKYDAVECLVNYIDERIEDETALKLVLTNTYDNPGKLNDAKSCVYLKSENMPSPMGMYLNPFQNPAEAEKAKTQNEGQIMSWEELRNEFASYK